MPTSTYTPLANITLGATAGSITFSSISQSYRDLVLVVNSRDTTSGSSTTQFTRVNNVSTSVYSYVYAGGNGSTTPTGSGSGTEWGMGLSTAASAAAGTFAQNIYHFMDYSATDKHKTVLLRTDEAGSAGTRMAALRYADTIAITTINILPATSFAAGTTATLYGIAA